MTSAYLREEEKNKVREAADIVQVIGEVVELKKAGVRYTGLCPFHAEKTPSFSVNPQGQFFHCFGCGESGDVFSFVMKYNRLTFPEALKELARRYQIDLPEPRLSEADRRRMREREILYTVNEKAAKIYEHYLDESADAVKARKYLEQRGVPAEVIRAFRIGYAPDTSVAGWSFVTSRLQGMNMPVEGIEKAGLAVRKESSGFYDRFRDRILFPIMNVSGQVIAFGGRILGDGQPKYMNSPESPVFDKSRVLFGLYQHKEKIRSCRKAIVVEGNFDLVLLAVYGIDNVVAPLGTALTRDHIRSLRGFCDEVVLLFDGDSAGLKAAMRSVPLFLAEQVDAKVAILPQGHDPDSFVREKGQEGITQLVDGACHLAEFVFDVLAKQFGTTLDGKNRIISELRQIVSSGDDSTQRSLMIAHFSELLSITQEQFQSGIADKRIDRWKKEENQQISFKKLPRKQRQLVNFMVFYPEFLGDLLEAGLEDVVISPAVMHIVDCLKELSATGLLTPDRLLMKLSEESGERRYVAELLVHGSPGDGEGEDGWARQMCDELLGWLYEEKRIKRGASLLQRIKEAQEAGDDTLLMELLVQKQEMGKNR